MKAVDRIIFVFVALLLIAVAAFCTLIAVDVISTADMAQFLQYIKLDIFVKVILFACAIVLFAVALKILFVSPKKTTIPAYTISKSDDGEIAISISAIENTFRLAMTEFEEIKEVRTHVGVTQSGISISAKVAIPTGVVIPELLQEVKNYTRVYTETHTGVAISQIRIVVTEYKTVDPITERKKIAAAKKQDEKNIQKEMAKSADAYASTHSRIVLSNANEENVEQEIISVNESTEQTTEQISDAE